MLSTKKDSQVPHRNNINIDDITFQRLSHNYGTDAFFCGVSQIDSWFERRSYVDHNRLMCRVLTAHLPNVPNPVGFFSMCLTTEGKSQFYEHSFIERVKYIFTNDQMLVCKLEWVAVDRAFQGKGIGKLLMGRAINDFAQVVDRTGVFALVIQAIDDGVFRFYRKLGFEPYGDNGLRKMVLPALSVIDARPP